MATPLTIESRLETEGVGLLAPAGEIDVSNTQQLREQALKLLASGARKLVVDLGGVEYMDSAGLGTLVGLLKRLREADGRLAIAGARPRVRRLFEITGLDQVFALYQDVGEAVKEAAQ